MTTIIIWDNNMASYRFGKHESKTIGHAALSINDTWAGDQYSQHSNVDWVSWWPGNNDPKGNRKGAAHHNIISDVVMEKYAPDHVLRLSGLNTQNMIAAWNAERTKTDAVYRFNTENCSTMVARILRAGTERAQRSTWHSHSCLWTPLKVKRFAINLGAKEIEWEDFKVELASAGMNCSQLNKVFKRRSNQHGNPKTPARFVDGVDTGWGDAPMTAAAPVTRARR